MRILIFSTAYHPFVGGAEIAIKEITDRLKDSEFDLITAKMDSNLPDVEKVGNVTVYRLGIGSALIDKLLVPFLGAFKARRLNRRHHYDRFWAMMASFASGAAYIHNIFFRNSKVPIVLTLQEGDSESHLKYRWGGLIDLSWRMALKRTAVVTAISSYLLNRAEKLGFKGESYLIPNGVDYERFSAKAAASSRNSGEIILITTSRLVKKNAIDDVIRALKYLPDNVRFIVVGTGPMERELKSIMHELSLHNRVEFRGYLDQGRIPQLLHESDIFIRPSLSEGMGNSFIEAMAAGLPVIATPVGGIVDFIFDPDTNPDTGPTGLFVKVRDPMDIARQVNRLINDEALRIQLIENGKMLARDKYDWNLIAKDMKEKVFDRPHIK